jgi:DNA polymerase I-like protein with 3'-5' exonuclease and polymerase domains
VAAPLAFPIQAAGAELVKEALVLLMPSLWSELPGVRLCHVIHAEILLEAPEALAQAAAGFRVNLAAEMRRAASLVAACRPSIQS